MKFLFTFVGLSIFWLLMSGVYKPLVIAFGFISVILVLLVNIRMNKHDSSPVKIDLRLIESFRYAIWLLYEILKSNLQVAKMILNRKKEIKAKFVDINLSQKTELGKVIFANSITLTPGTVAIEIEDNLMIVHALDGSKENLESLISMGQSVTKLEK